MTEGTRFKLVEKGSLYENQGDNSIMYIEVKCVGKLTRLGHFIADIIGYYIFSIFIGFILGFVLALFGESQSFIEIFSERNPNGPLYSSLFGLTIIVLYYLLSETFMHRTPGKFLTGSFVVNEYGEKPNFNAVLVRTVSRLVPFEPFSCLASSGRGWHDTWSHTFVVSKSELDEIKILLSVDQIGNIGLRREEENYEL